MSKFLRYEQCPRCVSLGRDSRGDNLGVYTDGGTHCFPCGFHTFPKYYQSPIVEEKVDGTKSVLPFDFTREVPTTAWKWLLQYSLPYSYWKNFVGYSENYQRLVFPVGEPTAFSIGRLVAQPGTIPLSNKPPRKWYVWGNCHNTVHSFGSGPYVVLVEDLISAHIVGQVTEAISLFGTNVSPSVVQYLMNIKKPVYMWLDKDQEGNVGKQALRLQVLTDNPVDIIVTDNDPKTYSINQLQEMLK